MIRKVAIYIRVSTIDQAKEGYSLEAQEKALKKWCVDREYEIFDLYADRGISGKDIEHRPEMNRLLKDAEEHKFDIVLFWALSRFTRSVSDLYVTLAKFSKENIAMASYTESFDTTSPMGRAMIGVVGVFAQLERELTSERVSAAMQERAEQGKRTCSEVLGYDLLGKDSLVINEDEAKYVRFCFEQYTRIKNLSKVAVLANQLGYKGKRGKSPTAWSIQKIINCPIYCGYYSYNGKKYKGNFTPIIDAALFHKAQVILTGQKK